MCELLGMSANVPTDICFSFTGLMQRGGRTGPHKDGWGIAFYEGKGFREFKDPHPSAQSEIAKLVKNYPIKSHIVISHIRQANSGRVCLENTHPFFRELWGRQWSFAHNGQLKSIKKLPLRFYKPIGSTDSEHAFCWLLDQLRYAFPDLPPREKAMWRFIYEKCCQLAEYGVCNILLSDAKDLVAFSTTKLVWITRKAPFAEAKLKDEEVVVNFKDETTPDDVVTVVATEPLTFNEEWHSFQENEMCVFKKGALVFQQNK